MNLKVIAALLVVPVLAWKGLHDSAEKQARINQTVVQHRMSVPQRAAFEACLYQTSQLPLQGWMTDDDSTASATPLMEFCACQSRQMVRVFSHGRYGSFRSILKALTLHDARLANLDDNDLASEWKHKPQTAQFVLQLSMLACARMERANSERSTKEFRTTYQSQAPS